MFYMNHSCSTENVTDANRSSKMSKRRENYMEKNRHRYRDTLEVTLVWLLPVFPWIFSKISTIFRDERASSATVRRPLATPCNASFCERSRKLPIRYSGFVLVVFHAVCFVIQSSGCIFCKFFIFQWCS